ncbi:unnamed protein product [Adineta ricciae]|uniref:EF-hand domain-containing protein n=1 Tax=Adineta ricciae TaxID=249248 RepID=A0A815HZX4_ADIRI|nr:unnamed protein product [Adineta ricciae]CAF1361189.1 unnamed protein product [Adineta ricciae]
MNDNNLLTVSSSIVSIDHRPIAISSNDSIRRVFKSSSSLNNSVMNVEHRRSTKNVRQCSITEMLLVYAQKDTESSANLHGIVNVLELHFNTYANEKHQIFFEDIFRILNDFHEQVTELVLIETMQFLQFDVLAPCTFENFLLILCYLPPIKQDTHSFLSIFNELDHNKDSYITFEDIQRVLPHLMSHFDEETIRTAIHTIDVDHDNDHLSYFDFVTSLIALQDCQLNTKFQSKGSF